MPFADPETLNSDDHEVIEDLRQRGFAVTIWTPQELDAFNVGAGDVEDASIFFINEAFGD